MKSSTPTRLLIGLSIALTFSLLSFSAKSEADETGASVAKPLSTALFSESNFTESDAILVVGEAGRILFEHNASQKMIVASLSKLITADLAISKWGLAHRFYTDFFQDGSKLIVKGYGDPFLVSEELDKIAKALKQRINGGITAILIDASYFDVALVPGRSSVADPYNAPLSAVSANFNTAFVSQRAGVLSSAELQTPLTKTAKKVFAAASSNLGDRTERVNLGNSRNAQINFAELLAAKLSLGPVQVSLVDSLPEELPLLYRHFNSHDLATVLRGTLEFSNNFISNQLYLMLADRSSVTFSQAQKSIQKALSSRYGWRGEQFEEGSGLSRKNRFSAQQIMQVLNMIERDKGLLKEYSMPLSKQAGTVVSVRAKSGTLDGVHTFAGYFRFGSEQIKFVFLFNRQVPYKFRESLLRDLLDQLNATREGSSSAGS